MTSAYILIVAMLILGGLIAALGDRIGTKVGKARLRLFQLRPKQTAIVITIGTGILISASTLVILFGLSESLRQGVFQLDEILKKRREITAQLEKVELEKQKVETELKKAQERQNSVQKLLITTGKEFKKTQNQLKLISTQTDKLKLELKTILQDKTKLLAEKQQIEEQSQRLEKSIRERDQDLQNQQIEIKEQEEILQQQEHLLEEQQQNLKQQEYLLEKQQQSLKKLQNQQNQLQSDIKIRDEQISKLDKNILAKDKILKDKENELLSLEKELGFYRREVEILEQYYQTYQDLRERPIAIVKGQVLTVTLVKTDKDTNLEELIDGILNEANRGVMLTLGYGNQFPNQRFVQITKGQVEQMKEQLIQKGEYLVRILSAGNYVQGEERVRIFADVTPNKKIYAKNETIASITIDSHDLKSTELQGKLDFLISVSEFRARREGILGKIFIGDGRIISLINFVQKLQLSKESVDEIIAVAANDTETSGPLQINLVVISGGKEILRF
ncbi:DUF3084 domain-containing protein [Geminocystis sp. GBBB08]|uniref:DUF3084 domain-containing protein n=1 Tax=Geminocystis sp. GBBB08 TaxID=2604140 RepID=UPI0027E24554|nr:DUF3084 domain-containing protein [Geminocystis sp. GBBB08]MBL1210821.1 DUF3084 domain-containing protein [Geminocystis sp. GBBB08]